jgi:hypothetical protein
MMRMIPPAISMQLAVTGEGVCRLVNSPVDLVDKATGVLHGANLTRSLTPDECMPLGFLHGATIRARPGSAGNSPDQLVNFASIESQRLF